MQKCNWHLCSNLCQAPKKYCCKKCGMKAAVSRRRRKLKIMAIAYKGGKCILCGYKKCVWALDFHHRDKTEKEFPIGAFGYTYSWQKIQTELDKCDLLCANCHRETEYKLRPDLC